MTSSSDLIATYASFVHCHLSTTSGLPNKGDCRDEKMVSMTASKMSLRRQHLATTSFSQVRHWSDANLERLQWIPP